SEHTGQTLPVATEADKHRPMRRRRPEWGIAAENMLFDPIHFDHRSRDMRRWTTYLLIQLGTRLFGPSNDLLLLLNRKRLESGDIVHPLLHQHHTPTCTGRPIWDECHLRRFRERRILGPVNETR